MAVNDNINFLFNLATQYKRNKRFNAKRKGTTKLKTEIVEKKREGTYEITPVSINRNAISTLIAKTSLSHIEVDFFTG